MTQVPCSSCQQAKLRLLKSRLASLRSVAQTLRSVAASPPSSEYRKAAIDLVALSEFHMSLTQASIDAIEKPDALNGG